VPQTILFATEIPPNEQVFAFALAQARNAHARLILFHAYDTLVVSASETSGLSYYDYAAAARTEIKHLEPFAERARQAGVDCEILVRQGVAPHLIVDCAHEKNADRVIMGSRCPGAIGKILLGSVAEEVLRSCDVPVCIIGPAVLDKAFQGYKIKTILAATSLEEGCYAPVSLAAQIALEEGARLILLHVIKPSEKANILAKRTLEQIEEDLKSLVPMEIRPRIAIEPMIIPGDAFEEILFQARAQHVDLMVLGAQEASIFSTLTRTGVVYKVLAHAPVPVLTLSANAAEHLKQVSPYFAHSTGSV